MTNHEKAKQYENKQKVLGEKLLEFNYLVNDRVELRKVNGDRERVIIPSFITDFDVSLGSIKEDGHGPFMGIDVKEIYIDNSADRDMELNGLLAFSNISRVKIEVAHPERIISVAAIFFRCFNLEEVESWSVPSIRWGRPRR